MQMEKEKATTFSCNRFFFCGDLDRIQTCNLLIRSQMLYSVELRSHFKRWVVKPTAIY